SGMGVADCPGWRLHEPPAERPTPSLGAMTSVRWPRVIRGPILRPAQRERGPVSEWNEIGDRLAAALRDTYEVLRELGGGGMSHVFVARERKLDREVVIKLLPLDLAGGVSLDRFLREI